MTVLNPNLISLSFRRPSDLFFCQLTNSLHLTLSLKIVLLVSNFFLCNPPTCLFFFQSSSYTTTTCLFYPFFLFCFKFLSFFVREINQLPSLLTLVFQVADQSLVLDLGKFSLSNYLPLLLFVLIARCGQIFLSFFYDRIEHEILKLSVN